jgi:Spy/CpxP family protein refolding chaperone
MYRRLLTFVASGLLVLGVALTGMQARAQGGPQGRGPRMSPEQRLEQLDQTLKLTDDQKSKIKPILEDQQKQMDALRSDSSLSQEDRRAKMRSIMQESNGKIRDLLTDDQKKQFDEMQQRRGPGRGGRGPGGGGNSQQ